jgi:hypothetical protein
MNTAATPPVSNSDWDTYWTNLTGASVFVTGTGDNSFTVGMS